MSELSFPNLVITIPQGTGKFTKDENGNPIEISTPVQIFAAAKKKRYPEFYKLPGISTADMQLEGKVVFQDEFGNWGAGSLPAFVNLEVEAVAAISFGARTQYGNFRFIPTTQSRFQSIVMAFGERISGFFRVTSRN